MDDQDKKEFEQVHKYRIAHPEKFTYHIEIKLHKIEK